MRLLFVKVTLVALIVGPLLAGCEAFSWGSDSEGQLGDGVVGGSRVAPGTAAAGFEWKVLRAGWNHNCGVRDDNTLWCWGVNNVGQLGDGTEDIDRPSPVQVGTASDWITVAPGLVHTCGIRAGGQMWCWGAGAQGQLGDGLSTGSLVPVRVGTFTDWQEVTAGGFRFTCGIRGEGDLYCWGANGDGQLGVGDTTDRATPTPVGGSPWKGVDAGTFHACAINIRNEPFCWGDNSNGQVSIFQSDTNFSSPTILNDTSAFQVAAGHDATCVLINGDFIGANYKGAGRCTGDLKGCDIGSAFFVSCNTGEADDLYFRQIDVRTAHACAIVVGSDAAMCWGQGTSGQLGNGSSSDVFEPVAVLGSKKWWSVSTGSNHTVGLERPPDTDGDDIPDEYDNCPTIANIDQADSNNDGVGDACTPPGC